MLRRVNVHVDLHHPPVAYLLHHWAYRGLRLSLHTVRVGAVVVVAAAAVSGLKTTANNRAIKGPDTHVSAHLQLAINHLRKQIHVIGADGKVAIQITTVEDVIHYGIRKGLHVKIVHKDDHVVSASHGVAVEVGIAAVCLVGRRTGRHHTRHRGRGRHCRDRCRC